MISAISTALSGLVAASKKVETGASNIANLGSGGALDPADGRAPYSTRQTVQRTDGNGGVIADIVTRDPGFVPAYDPNSPFANEDGLIGVPNTDLAEEAVNLKLAETAYRANLATIKTVQETDKALFEIFDKKV